MDFEGGGENMGGVETRNEKKKKRQRKRKTHTME